jgi:thymidylate kinase
MAIIISLEGPDRHGKTTQAAMLCESILHSELNLSVTMVEFPSSGPFSLWIKSMLKSGSALKYPTLFQFLQFLNKLLFQLFVLPQLATTYDYIILGRWNLSTIAYGNATGVNKAFSKLMYRMLIKPHRTIVILGKQFERDGGDRYDVDEDLQNRVINNYKRFVGEFMLNDKTNTGSIKFVSNFCSGNLPKEKCKMLVHNRILYALKGLV